MQGTILYSRIRILNFLSFKLRSLIWIRVSLPLGFRFRSVLRIQIRQDDPLLIVSVKDSETLHNTHSSTSLAQINPQEHLRLKSMLTLFLLN